MSAATQKAIANLFKLTGVLAIVTGGLLSAFFARQPSTFVMWASAYLVLVVGLAQVLFGTAAGKLPGVDARPANWLVYAQFNAGNALVIASTAMKYAGHGQHLGVTAVGSTLVVAGLALFAWVLRVAPSSRLKTGAYVVIVVLAVATPIGMVLAAM